MKRKIVGKRQPGDVVTVEFDMQVRLAITIPVKEMVDMRLNENLPWYHFDKNSRCISKEVGLNYEEMNALRQSKNFVNTINSLGLSDEEKDKILWPH